MTGTGLGEQRCLPHRRVPGEGLDSPALTDDGGRGSVYRGEEGDMLQKIGSSGGPSVCT